ncbi:MAG: hypothetical protein R2844_08510 [Caldilineales bacterium]
MQLRDRSIIWRTLLLVVCLLAGLVLVNAAMSLFDVWQLDTGAPVPTPWSNLFDAGRASQRSDTLALLGTALLGGAGLACLIFFLERSIKGVVGWTQDKLRK